MEKTFDEIKEIFLKDLEPRKVKKLSRKIKSTNYREFIRRIEENEPYTPEAQKFIYDSSRLILRRKPTDGELKHIAQLWREEMSKIIVSYRATGHLPIK